MGNTCKQKKCMDRIFKTGWLEGTAAFCFSTFFLRGWLEPVSWLYNGARVVSAQHIPMTYKRRRNPEEWSDLDKMMG